MPQHAPVVARLRAAGCVFAEDEARLLVAAAGSPAELEALVARRVSGVPLEYLLGWAEFAGLRLVVAEGVFVPRRRTELLVAEALALLAGVARPVVVDLCCGCGAIGAAIAASRGETEIHAVDADPVAVGCARRNLPAGQVYQGDLDAPLPGSLLGSADVVLANAPYVPTAAIDLMPREARLYERPMALDGGADGLDVQRRVVAAAPRWLVPGGHLLVETSEPQAAELARAFARGGFEARVVRETDGLAVVGTLRS